jgi:hypothetical protein
MLYFHKSEDTHPSYIDRLLQHAAQRRELQEAADERRLKACLRADAERADAITRKVMGESFRRAFSAAVEHGMSVERAHDDKAAPLPHPSDKGRRPIISPAGEVSDKGRKWACVLPGSFETGRR